MQSVVHGTLSRNMVKRGWLANFSQIQIIPSTYKEMIDNSWTIQVSDTNEMVKTHTLQDKEFTSKKIHSILIKDIALTMKDIDMIQQMDFRNKTLHKHKINVDRGTTTLSIFNSHVPKPMLSRLIPIDDLDCELVIWSISLDNNASEQFLCPVHISYQDFLLFVSKYISAGKFDECRIDFELFIYTLPVVFGKAYCTINSTHSEYSFLFSRVVVCSTMKENFI
jgi:hypothetical protein